MTRVLLVDDHALFLDGLRNLLTAEGVDVVGVASDGLEALSMARALHPNVILMDVQMPRCDGLQATRMIKAEYPEIKIVMLSVSAEDDELFGAIQCGASGFLLKSENAKEFFHLLEKLSQGEVPLSRGLSARILAEFARRANGKPKADRAAGGDMEGLTARQIEILTFAVQGLTYAQIGANLCISEHTVKYHMKQILDRLHLENRTQLIAYAHESGLLSTTRPGGVASSE